MSTIQPINNYGYYMSLMSNCSQFDMEEREIIRRLKMYGVNPTGNKEIDRATLHTLELEEVKNLNNVENKFFTITEVEQEKIIASNLTKQENSVNEINQNNNAGAAILGEQIYLAIQMKKNKLIQ